MDIFRIFTRWLEWSLLDRFLGPLIFPRRRRGDDERYRGRR
jgi:hypothetical protein